MGNTTLDMCENTIASQHNGINNLLLVGTPSDEEDTDVRCDEHLEEASVTESVVDLKFILANSPQCPHMNGNMSIIPTL